MELILDSLYDPEVNQNMLQYSEKAVSETQTQLFRHSSVLLYMLTFISLVESQHELIFETLSKSASLCFSCPCCYEVAGRRGSSSYWEGQKRFSKPAAVPPPCLLLETVMHKACLHCCFVLHLSSLKMWLHSYYFIQNTSFKSYQLLSSANTQQVVCSPNHALLNAMQTTTMETFSQAFRKLSCNSGHSERKVMALSQSSKMWILAEEGPGQSICRAVTATPLQINNIHLIEYTSGVDVKPSLLAVPRLSSCPVHKDSTCNTKIHHCLPWHQTPAERMQCLRGGGSGAVVSVRLKSLPKVCLEGIHGCSQIFPLIAILAAGLKGLPSPGLPVSREGRGMHGR